jgi:hypothetical protein
LVTYICMRHTRGCLGMWRTCSASKLSTCCLQVCHVLLQTENMLDMMTLTSGTTTNSTEESAVARHLHVTVSQRVGGP